MPTQVSRLEEVLVVERDVETVLDGLDVFGMGGVRADAMLLH